MGAQTAHEATAANNRKVIAILRGSQEACVAPWIIIAAMYAGVHVIEAVLASIGEHSETHHDRHLLLKSNRRYAHLFKHYKEIHEAAAHARYNPSHGFRDPVFSGKHFVDHLLHQVEMSAAKLLKDNDFVNRVRA